MPRTPSLTFAPERILAPIDFSQSSRAALETAIDLAGHFDAELFVVNVIPIFSTTTLPDFIPESNYIEERRKEAERRFARLRDTLEGKGMRVASIIEEGNDVASNIMEVVEREKIDFLVISTHGITGWHPLVFGSIAEKIVKMVQCPILLLRSAKPESTTNVDSDRPTEWW